MLRLVLRTLTGWGFGRMVSLVSPLQKFSVGLSVAMWVGLAMAVLGFTAVWFYPDEWFGENVLDFFGGLICLVAAGISYAAFAVKNFQDQKVEELSDLGQKQFSKVLASAKTKLEKTQENNKKEGET